MIDVLVFSVPLALAAIGETITQKSGTINLSVEGEMLLGAFTAFMVTHATGNVALGLSAGIAAGWGLAMLFGLFTLVWKRDQIVTGTAINLLALGLTGALYRNQFGETGKLLSVAKLPAWNGVDPILGATVILAGLAFWALSRTAWGLLIRACGEYPPAVEASGHSVTWLQIQALSIGGTLAAAGGAYLSLGISGSFSENMTAGRGFVAIAIVTFGRWNPLLVFGAALFMGYLDTLQFTFQAKGWNVPFQLLLALPYVVALAVLVVIGRGTLAPSALGNPYKEGV